MITSIKPELRSMRLDRRQCCWHVSYRFCGLSTEIIVHAENEAEARAKAVDQLRLRGLKWPEPLVPPRRSAALVGRGRDVASNNDRV